MAKIEPVKSQEEKDSTGDLLQKMQIEKPSLDPPKQGLSEKELDTVINEDFNPDSQIEENKGRYSESDNSDIFGESESEGKKKILNEKIAQEMKQVQQVEEQKEKIQSEKSSDNEFASKYQKRKPEFILNQLKQKNKQKQSDKLQNEAKPQIEQQQKSLNVQTLKESRKATQIQSENESLYDKYDDGSSSDHQLAEEPPAQIQKSQPTIDGTSADYVQQTEQEEEPYRYQDQFENKESDLRPKRRKQETIKTVDVEEHGYVIPAQTDDQFFEGGTMGNEIFADQMKLSQAGPMRVDNLHGQDEGAPRSKHRLTKEEAESRMNNLEALHAQWDREKMEADLRETERRRKLGIDSDAEFEEQEEQKEPEYEPKARKFVMISESSDDPLPPLEKSTQSQAQQIKRKKEHRKRKKRRQSVTVNLVEGTNKNEAIALGSSSDEIQIISKKKFKPNNQEQANVDHEPKATENTAEVKLEDNVSVKIEQNNTSIKLEQNVEVKQEIKQEDSQEVKVEVKSEPGIKLEKKDQEDKESDDEIAMTKKGYLGDVIKGLEKGIKPEEREKVFTHFISIPLASNDIIKGYELLKQRILQENFQNVTPECFTPPGQLHLTVLKLNLTDPQKLEQAQKVLKSLEADIAEDWLVYRRNPIKLKFKGVQTASHKKQVRTIFVDLISEHNYFALHRITSQVVAKFVSQGLSQGLRKEKLIFNPESMLWEQILGMTIMRARGKRFFNIDPIKKKFGTYFLGQHSLVSIQLCSRTEVVYDRQKMKKSSKVNKYATYAYEAKISTDYKKYLPDNEKENLIEQSSDSEQYKEKKRKRYKKPDIYDQQIEKIRKKTMGELMDKARQDFRYHNRTERQDRPLPPDPKPDDPLTEDESVDQEEDSSMPSFVNLYEKHRKIRKIERATEKALLKNQTQFLNSSLPRASKIKQYPRKRDPHDVEGWPAQDSDTLSENEQDSSSVSSRPLYRPQLPEGREYMNQLPMPNKTKPMAGIIPDKNDEGESFCYEGEQIDSLSKNQTKKQVQNNSDSDQQDQREDIYSDDSEAKEKNEEMGEKDSVERVESDIDFDFYPDKNKQYGKNDQKSLIFEEDEAVREYATPIQNQDRTIFNRPNMLIRDITRRQQYRNPTHEGNPGMGSYVCNLCDYSYQSKRGLDQHMLKKHPVINNVYGLTAEEKRKVKMLDPNDMDICYICKICKFKYSNRASLRQHFILKHPKENADWIKRKKEAELFSQKVDGKFQCKWCDKLYISKGALSIHVNGKHPEERAKLKAKKKQLVLTQGGTVHKRKTPLSKDELELKQMIKNSGHDEDDVEDYGDEGIKNVQDDKRAFRKEIEFEHASELSYYSEIDENERNHQLMVANMTKEDQEMFDKEIIDTYSQYPDGFLIHKNETLEGQLYNEAIEVEQNRKQSVKNGTWVEQKDPDFDDDQELQESAEIIPQKQNKSKRKGRKSKKISAYPLPLDSDELEPESAKNVTVKCEQKIKVKEEKVKLEKIKEEHSIKKKKKRNKQIKKENSLQYGIKEEQGIKSEEKTSRKRGRPKKVKPEISLQAQESFLKKEQADIKAEIKAEGVLDALVKSEHECKQEQVKTEQNTKQELIAEPLDLGTNNFEVEDHIVPQGVVPNNYTRGILSSDSEAERKFNDLVESTVQKKIDKDEQPERLFESEMTRPSPTELPELERVDKQSQVSPEEMGPEADSDVTPYDKAYAYKPRSSDDQIKAMLEELGREKEQALQQAEDNDDTLWQNQIRKSSHDQLDLPDLEAEQSSESTSDIDPTGSQKRKYKPLKERKPHDINKRFKMGVKLPKRYEDMPQVPQNLDQTGISYTRPDKFITQQLNIMKKQHKQTPSNSQKQRNSKIQQKKVQPSSQNDQFEREAYEIAKGTLSGEARKISTDINKGMKSRVQQLYPRSDIEIPEWARETKSEDSEPISVDIVHAPKVNRTFTKENGEETSEGSYVCPPEQRAALSIEYEDEKKPKKVNRTRYFPPQYGNSPNSEIEDLKWFHTPTDSEDKEEEPKPVEKPKEIQEEQSIKQVPIQDDKTFAVQISPPPAPTKININQINSDSAEESSSSEKKTYKRKRDDPMYSFLYNDKNAIFTQELKSKKAKVRQKALEKEAVEEREPQFELGKIGFLNKTLKSEQIIKTYKLKNDQLIVEERPDGNQLWVEKTNGTQGSLLTEQELDKQKTEFFDKVKDRKETKVITGQQQFNKTKNDDSSEMLIDSEGESLEKWDKAIPVTIKKEHGNDHTSGDSFSTFEDDASTFDPDLSQPPDVMLPKNITMRENKWDPFKNYDHKDFLRPAFAQDTQLQFAPFETPESQKNKTSKFMKYFPGKLSTDKRNAQNKTKSYFQYAINPHTGEKQRMYTEEEIYGEPRNRPYTAQKILVNELDYIMNTYPEKPELPVMVFKREMRRSLGNFLTQFFAKYETISRKKFNCLGEETIDPSMYEGSAGIVYGLYRYVLLLRQDAARHPGLRDMLKSAEKNLEQGVLTNIALIDREGKKKEKKCSSFLMSEQIGVATLGCLHILQMKNEEDKDWALFAYLFKFKILAGLPRANSQHQGVFHGAAGYMYSLLTLYRHMYLQCNRENVKLHLAQLEEAIQRLVNMILNSCLKSWEIDMTTTSEKTVNNTKVTQTLKRLRGKNKRASMRCLINNQAYLGAANGICGVLYMLLKACQALEVLTRDKKLMQYIELTIDEVRQQMHWSGILPTHLKEKDSGIKTYRRPNGEVGSYEADSKKQFVQFCNGSPGSIPMFTLAAQIFPYNKDKYMETAQKAGEVTWRQGLLRKGHGLCHGISGNGYLLHNLFRSLALMGQKEEDPDMAKHYNENAIKWRNRSFLFARALSDGPLMKQIRKYEHSYRLAKGVADHPYSLMEGISGDICFLSDMLRDENEVRFPGFEI